jgi:hypothetical protein
VIVLASHVSHNLITISAGVTFGDVDASNELTTAHEASASHLGHSHVPRPFIMVVSLTKLEIDHLIHRTFFRAKRAHSLSEVISLTWRTPQHSPCTFTWAHNLQRDQYVRVISLRGIQVILLEVRRSTISVRSHKSIS